MTIANRIGLCFLSLAITKSAVAQKQVQTNVREFRDDVSQLKKDVEQLSEQQQQIITRLDELKQLLQANGQPTKVAAQSRPQPPSTLDVHGENFRGDEGAHVAMIEYADFECPYCGDFERRTFPHILNDYIQTGKVKYYYRDLPLQIHGLAVPAARAARCAGEQGKYWEMHDGLFAEQHALSAPALLARAQTLGLDSKQFTECFSGDKYNEAIHKNTSDAQKYGINGTPTFFIGTIDGDVVNVKAAIQGSVPLDVFKIDLDKLLATNGQEPVLAH